MTFQKDQSRNPPARPPGARNTSKIIAETLADGDPERITEKLVEKARKGHLGAARLVMQFYCGRK